MEFQVFSDIHLEFFKNPDSYPKISPLAPYLFLAGDIGKINHIPWINFISYCSANWKQIYYVLGNHEFYHAKKTLVKLINEYKEFTNKFSNVHLLDNESVDISNTGYQVYGFTAWTQCNFRSTSEAQTVLNDYYHILYKKDNSLKNELITPQYINELSNDQTKKFIEFISNTTKPTIVLTHFPPIKLGTSDPKYLAQNPPIINNYFSWNDLITSKQIPTFNIKSWISGHTHWSYDFVKYDVNFIGNQTGYKEESGKTGIIIDKVYKII